MSERMIAAWVSPVAAMLDADRLEVIAFARSAPPALWGQPSDLDGWTNRDILSHLAGGNDLLLQKLLRSVVAREPIDPALFQLDTDAENASGVEERRTWSLDRLIAELERDRAEVQYLLSRLTEEERDLRWTGFSLSLGELLRIIKEERHDLIHLEQMRAGLRSGHQTP
jgi:hypothetical protein